MSDPLLYDVVAVSIRLGIVTDILAEGKTFANAEAIVKMAVMWPGNETEFFAIIPAGSCVVGDKF